MGELRNNTYLIMQLKRTKLNNYVNKLDIFKHEKSILLIIQLKWCDSHYFLLNLCFLGYKRLTDKNKKSILLLALGKREC